MIFLVWFLFVVQFDFCLFVVQLCRVEFKYWGMQTRTERFIHDVALRKTMVRAHRQAWAWQDEWHGLEMDDIRRLEKETELALRGGDAGAGDDQPQPPSLVCV